MKKLSALELLLCHTLREKGPMSGYDLTKYVNSLEFWSVTHQQVYRECDRLFSNELVVFTGIPQTGKPDKYPYSLTEKGEQLFLNTISGPARKPEPVRDLTLLYKHIGFDSSVQAKKDNILEFAKTCQDDIVARILKPYLDL